MVAWWPNKKDRNRHGGGVACFIRSDICYNSKKILQDDKTKPTKVGIVYKPPKQIDFIEKLTYNF